MKESFVKIFENFKSFLAHVRNLCIWLLPFVGFLAIIGVPSYFLKLGFDNFLKLVTALVWPVTILIALAFFRKVFTYLFFQMEEFNFFGAKGKLISVNDMITKEVSKKLTQEKDQRAQSEEMEELSKELERKQKALSAKSKDVKVLAKESQENLTFAMDLFRQRKEAQKQNEKLQKEVMSLRQYIVNNGHNMDNSISNESQIGAGEGSAEKDGENESV